MSRSTRANESCGTYKWVLSWFIGVIHECITRMPYECVTSQRAIPRWNAFRCESSLSLEYSLIDVAVCCSVLQCVAVCCSVLQCVAVSSTHWLMLLLCVAVCCSVLQCVTACCGLDYSLIDVAVCCSVLQCVAVCCCVLQCVTACCSLEYSLIDVAVCCSVLQCVAVCYSVLQSRVLIDWCYFYDSIWSSLSALLAALFVCKYLQMRNTTMILIQMWVIFQKRTRSLTLL